MGFKDSLRRYREQAGYAQAKDFSAALDIKYTTYIAYEQGREPKYDILCRIAAALNVTTDELLGHSPPDKYEICKNRLTALGFLVRVEPDGKILVRFDEKASNDTEISRIYNTANIAEIGFPGKTAVVELVRSAENAALQSGFLDALLTQLLPWFIAARNTPSENPDNPPIKATVEPLSHHGRNS